MPAALCAAATAACMSRNLPLLVMQPHLSISVMCCDFHANFTVEGSKMHVCQAVHVSGCGSSAPAACPAPATAAVEGI